MLAVSFISICCRDALEPMETDLLDHPRTSMRNGNQRPREHPALLDTSEAVITLLAVVSGWFAWYLALRRYHLTSRQVAELACYIAIASTSFCSVTYLVATR